MPPGAWPGTGGARHSGGAWRTAPWSLDGRDSGRGRTHRKREGSGGRREGENEKQGGIRTEREKERGGEGERAAQSAR